MLFGAVQILLYHERAKETENLHSDLVFPLDIRDERQSNPQIMVIFIHYKACRKRGVIVVWKKKQKSIGVDYPAL